MTRRFPWFIALCLLVSACGWHLRGAIDLPDGLQAIAIHTGKNGQETAQALRQSLVAAGVEATTDGSLDNAWQLDILDETLERREISISREVRTADYGLTLRVQWQLRNPQGDIVIGATTSQAQSNYRHNTDNLVGKQREEDRLVSDMRRYVAGQILRRIEYSQKASPAPVSP